MKLPVLPFTLNTIPPLFSSPFLTYDFWLSRLTRCLFFFGSAAPEFLFFFFFGSPRVLHSLVPGILFFFFGSSALHGYVYTYSPRVLQFFFFVFDLSHPSSFSIGPEQKITLFLCESRFLIFEVILVFCRFVILFYYLCLIFCWLIILVVLTIWFWITTCRSGFDSESLCLIWCSV
jgi:hypothetical protein